MIGLLFFFFVSVLWVIAFYKAKVDGSKEWIKLAFLLGLTSILSSCAEKPEKGEIPKNTLQKTMEIGIPWLQGSGRTIDMTPE